MRPLRGARAGGGIEALAPDAMDVSDDDEEMDAGGDDAGGATMAVDGAAGPGASNGAGGRHGKGKVSPEFKAKVGAILQEGGFQESRASKMSQEELLALLAAFNAGGIHFV